MPVPILIPVPLEISFTAVGTSKSVAVTGVEPVVIDFSTGTGVGTIEIERSTDEGVTWVVLRKPDFTTASFSNTDGDIDLNVDHQGAGARYRFNCSAFTSGGISCRLGQKSQA